ncbi:MAG: hypothetical protein ACOX25_04935 [Caldicoprobacterales bacterium]
MQIFTILVINATLDSTTNQCSERLTDGKELRNRYFICRLVQSIVALV